MVFATIIFALLFYAATAVLVVGLAKKIHQYATTPAPLKIPTMPAPMTRSGVAWRMGRELFFFHSLFRANKWTWLFGFAFHAALVLVLLRHMRYFTEPVWAPIVAVQPWGIYAAAVMVIGLAGLWARRLLVERVRYITGPSDHLMLLLLVGIALTGLGTKFLLRTDIIAVKAFFLGLIRFDWQPLPSDPLLLLHLALVIALMIVFPFSKLLHAPGVFFSPTRNQADDSRTRRHLVHWAAVLQGERED
jgi:nitrate reductase gamma subunit